MACKHRGLGSDQRCSGPLIRFSRPEGRYQAGILTQQAYLAIDQVAIRHAFAVALA